MARHHSLDTPRRHVLAQALAAVLALLLCAPATADPVLPGPIPLTGAPQYSGFLSVNETTGSEMYYWLFEQTDDVAGAGGAARDGARNRSLADTPLVVWLEGGPGIGSLFQVFYGMGPYRIAPGDAGAVSFNEQSWVRHAHLLFLDNPCGTGFSRVADGHAVTNEDEVAVQLYAALESFYAAHPEFAACPLWIFGESYGGKYVPAVASFIVAREQSGDNAVPLAGIGIGNGLVDTPTQMNSYVPFLRSHSIASKAGAADVALLVESFERFYSAGLYENASNVFWEVNFNAQLSFNINFYDIECYLSCSQTKYAFGGMTELLLRADVQKQLNAPGTVYASPSPVTTVSMNADVSKSVRDRIGLVLDHYPVLLYQGARDFIVNAIGTEQWLARAVWAGKEEWERAPRHTWFSRENDYAPGAIDVAGYVQQAGHLTYVVLPSAGHFAPMDLPRTTRDMMRRFVYGLPWTLRE